MPGGGGGGSGLGEAGGSGGTAGGAGGSGAYGAGGGGGSSMSAGGAGGTFGGGGGAYGHAGAGGFGGGGGGSVYGLGGAGGFGGGSGGSVFSTANVGGAGAGTGSSGINGATAGGGGGAGLGGAIFVNSGASLVIGNNVTFEGSSAEGGAAGGTAATGGAGAGSDLFLMSGTTTGFSPGEGNRIILSGSIADDSAHSLTGEVGGAGTGAGATIAVSGGGTVELSGESTIAGGFTVDGATLELTETGVISAPGTAVELVGSGAILDNAGLIEGASIDGASNALTDIVGAVLAAESGTISNSGTIRALGSANVAAIRADSDLSIGNQGLIHSDALSGYGLLGTSTDSLLTVTNSAGAVISSGGSAIVTIGALDLTNAGLIHSEGGNGISFAGGTVNNLSGGVIAGSQNGILLEDSSASVINAGRIEGNNYGIGAFGPITVANSPGGIITGGNIGIVVADSGALDLSNSGAILGGSFGISTGAGGTIINEAAGTITGMNSAITSTGTAATTLTNGGDLIGGVSSLSGGDLNITNEASGNIIGEAIGSAILLNGGGRLELTNAGDIVGSSWGVIGRNAGDSIVNSGRIASGTISGDTITLGSYGVAIYLEAGGSLENQAGGLVQSYGNALVAHGPTTLVNGGTIQSTGSDAVQFTGTASVENLAGGSIIAQRIGIYSGSSLDLTNDGLISGNAYGAVYAWNGATITNNANGVIAGLLHANAIQAYGNVTLTNAGSISAADGVLASVYLSGGNATVANSGSITGSGWGVLFSGSDGSLSVTNSGSITGGVYNAVYAGSGSDNSVINLAGGTLTGGNAAVYGDGTNLVVSNAGVIRALGGTVNLVGSGIYANAAGAIITNSGTIESLAENGRGVYLYAGGEVTNHAPGVIEGATGIALGAASTVSNDGAIIGNEGNGIVLAGGGTVTNLANGAISGSESGIHSEGAPLVLENEGAISGDAGNGVTALGAINATNAAGALISSEVRAGIAASGGGTIVNAGTITGGSDAASGFGLHLAGGDFVVTNQAGGTLAGEAGAILLAGDGTVIIGLEADSTVNGDIVTVGAGSHLLDVEGTVNGLFDGSAGTGIDMLRLGETGSLGGALLGAGDDALTIAGGTLAGPADGGEGIDTLLFDMASDAAFGADQLTGFESRSKEGAGTLTLTGVDAMTIDFAVIGGTLALSGGAALNDAAAVDVAEGATLRLDDSEAIRALTGSGQVDLGDKMLGLAGNDSTTFSGVISGSGGLAKFGTGTFTLTGANEYTGITYIDAGSIALGASGALSSSTFVSIGSAGLFDLAGFDQAIGGLEGEGSVELAGGWLTVDQAVDSLFAGSVIDSLEGESGGLIKDGAGALYLTGDSSFAGETHVNGGLLSVNGSLLSAVIVNEGGYLGGNGSIAGLVVNAGGTLAPGNSIGHLTVDGDLTFGDGSIYEVEITPTASDLTTATGDIVIEGGTVAVLAAPGLYQPVTNYLILEAGGAVTGTFDEVTSNLAFLDPALTYTSDQVILSMRRNDIDFANVAVNFNQASVATALQSMDPGEFFDLILLQSESGARSAYDALAGQIHATAPAIVAETGNRMRDAMLRSGRDSPEGFSGWADAKAGQGTFDGSPLRGSSGGKTRDRALFGGIQWRGQAFDASIGVGTASNAIRLNLDGGDAEIDTQSVGAQIGYRGAMFRANVGASLAWHSIETDRSIMFPGLSETASSERKGHSRHFYGELAMPLNPIRSISVEPFARLTHQRTRLHATSEDGGIAALEIDSSLHRSTASELGMRIEANGTLAGGRLTPRLSVGWQHLMGDRLGVMTASFESSDNFTILGARRARDSARIDAGLDYERGSVRLGAGFETRLSTSQDDYGLRFSAGIRF
ncbi:MAG: autotransporter-associated beta strand repeat-containing protein [Sphingomonas sp.]|nr:autotransporter-associated beta strand repeat-containing protein [Sphingomonas sp.]